ncbi:hypothetical protein ACHAXT_007705 [Thalassiosira profunda]
MTDNIRLSLRRRRSSEALGMQIDGGDAIPGAGSITNPRVGVDVRSERSISIGGAGDRHSSEAASSARLQFYRRFYSIHSACVLLVLLLGIIHNGGNRKYIPVNPKALPNLITVGMPANLAEKIAGMDACRRAYVDVHSSSIEEEHSAICCSAANEGSRHQSNLCSTQILGISTQQLPFARRLTRLTEAWILPLLPLLIRLAYQLAMHTWKSTQRYLKGRSLNDSLQREATSVSSSSSSSLSSNTSTSLLEKSAIDASAHEPHSPNDRSIRQTLLRLLLYFLLLNFRGWGLYIGANALEDYVILPWLTGNKVVSPLRTHTLSDEEHDLQYSGNEPQCWYKDVLKAHHKSVMENDEHSDCYGRPFDFSDHVVLFLAHYLPVFVMEMLICYSILFWNPSGAEKRKKRRMMEMAAWSAIYGFLFLYLHLIVLHSLYQTAVYFHTPGEILVGYVVSLFLQLPVAYLMCSKRASKMRRYLGLPEGGTVSKKGD